MIQSQNRKLLVVKIPALPKLLERDESNRLISESVKEDEDEIDYAITMNNLLMGGSVSNTCDDEEEITVTGDAYKTDVYLGEKAEVNKRQTSGWSVRHDLVIVPCHEKLIINRY